MTSINPREVLDRAIRSNLESMTTLTLARVLAYDLASASARVRLVHARRNNLDVLVEPLVLDDVPCLPLAFGEWIVHAPYAPGDYVLLGAIDRSIDEWMTGASARVEALDTRRFNARDAVVLRRIDDDASRPSPDAGALVITNRSGSTRIKLDASGVTLGGASAQPIALAPNVATNLNAILANLTALNAAVNTLLPGSVPTPYVPTPVAAIRSKAE